MIFLLLLLIPIFCMSAAVYVASLWEFATSELNYLPFLLSIFGIVITGYILPRLFYKLYKSDTAGSLNAENKFVNFSNYISYIVMLFFAITLVVRGIINKSSGLEIYLGFGLIFLFIYVTYVYYVAYEKITFEVNDIVPVNKDTNMMYIEANDIGIKELYVSAKDDFEIGKKYNFKYNKNSKVFKSNKPVK